ncbi:MAG: YigZ family protein [Eubacterium sp.]|nr:YigZ family protein [Candidatus Colimonas fimequi]
MELYRTVKAPAEATQIIEKSRFIAHVMPIESREEGDAFLAEIRGKYKDATHNVPAFVIGDKFQIQWASDDGEPQGTSGAPMVQMLVKEGITNVAVVVTRYFGGIKLGTGGLVRAYTSSAKLGLEAAGVCRVMEVAKLNVKIEYTYLAKLQNLASSVLPESGDEDAAFTITDTQYDDKVRMELAMLPEHKDAVISILANLTSGSAAILSDELILSKI